MRQIELRLSTDAPMLLELEQEAQLRGVELTHHIHDLLRSRYLLRRGQSFQELLWYRDGSTSTHRSSSLRTGSRPSAHAAVAAWADLIDTKGV
jgi:hypothetical protein